MSLTKRLGTLQVKMDSRYRESKVLVERVPTSVSVKKRIRSFLYSLQEVRIGFKQGAQDCSEDRDRGCTEVLDT